MSRPPRLERPSSVLADSEADRARVAVLIPAHREPEAIETFTFGHTTSVLSRRPTFLVCPDSLDVSGYLAIAPSLGVLRVEDEAMQSWHAYSILMTGPDVYKAFAWADYVLIVQLDAIVLADELDRWTDGEIDCVGPPWFTRGPDLLRRPPGPAVCGIGGVTLRRTQRCIDVLEQTEERRSTLRLPITRLHRSPKWKVADHVRAERSWVRTLENTRSGALTEDNFWAMEVPRWFEWNMPSPRESLEFAIDFFPRISLGLAATLPLAVHGRPNIASLFAVSTGSPPPTALDEYRRGDTPVLEGLLRR